jgi:hypothetical protein
MASGQASPSAAISARLTPARSTSVARLAGNGIGPSRFGQSERQVLAGLDAIFGPPARSYRASGYGCGVDHEMDWPGLTADFGRGRFIGYSYRGADLKTAAGLRVGDSIRQHASSMARPCGLASSKTAPGLPAPLSANWTALPAVALATVPTLAHIAGWRPSRLAQSDAPP